MTQIWLKRNRFHVIQAVHTATYQSDDTRNNQIWVTRRGRVDDNQIRADWAHCVNVTLIFCVMILFLHKPRNISSVSFSHVDPFYTDDV